MQKKYTKTFSVIMTVGCIVLVGFLVSRAIPVIRGSQITLHDIPTDSEVTTPNITLSGKAFDTKNLLVNGTTITLSPDGKFIQTLLLHSGYNLITLETTDFLGKQKKHNYAFLLKETETGTFALSKTTSQN